MVEKYRMRPMRPGGSGKLDRRREFSDLRGDKNDDSEIDDCKSKSCCCRRSCWKTICYIISTVFSICVVLAYLYLLFKIDIISIEDTSNRPTVTAPSVNLPTTTSTTIKTPLSTTSSNSTLYRTTNGNSSYLEVNSTNDFISTSNALVSSSKITTISTTTTVSTTTTTSTTTTVSTTTTMSTTTTVSTTTTMSTTTTRTTVTTLSLHPCPLILLKPIQTDNLVVLDNTTRFSNYTHYVFRFETPSEATIGLLVFEFKTKYGSWYLDDLSIKSSDDLGSELIRNGGFENGIFNLIWKYCYPIIPSLNAHISSQFCHSGRYCFASRDFDDYSDYLTQTFNVQGNIQYTIEFDTFCNGEPDLFNATISFQ